MEHASLDSLEYESTYLELRPEGERAVATTDTPASAELGATMRRTRAYPKRPGAVRRRITCVHDDPAPRTYARRASSRY